MSAHGDRPWWTNGCICRRAGPRTRAAVRRRVYRRSYGSKTELALEVLERALAPGHLKAGWVAADDAFGMSPSFREGLAALGMRYVLDIPGGATVWPLEPALTSPEYQGFGRSRKPKLRGGQRRTIEQRSDELSDEAWREITVAQGSQDPRTYRFSAQRVRATKRRKLGEEIWAVYCRNLDGIEPRYYLPNAPGDTPLKGPNEAVLPCATFVMFQKAVACVYHRGKATHYGPLSWSTSVFRVYCVLRMIA